MSDASALEIGKLLKILSFKYKRKRPNGAPERAQWTRIHTHSSWVDSIWYKCAARGRQFNCFPLRDDARSRRWSSSWRDNILIQSSVNKYRLSALKQSIVIFLNRVVWNTLCLHMCIECVKIRCVCHHHRQNICSASHTFGQIKSSSIRVLTPPRRETSSWCRSIRFICYIHYVPKLSKQIK